MGITHVVDGGQSMGSASRVLWTSKVSGKGPGTCRLAETAHAGCREVALEHVDLIGDDDEGVVLHLVQLLRTRERGTGSARAAALWPPPSVQRRAGPHLLARASRALARARSGPARFWSWVHQRWAASKRGFLQVVLVGVGIVRVG